MKVLSGDVGGTNCRLACYECDGVEVELLADATYPSGEASSFSFFVRRFLEEQEIEPDAAGFGLPGPVRERRCRTTNLPWVVDAADLEQELSIPRVVLMNDLEATAWGIGALGAEDLLTLQAGVPSDRSNQAVIAAGTGLGQAALCWDGRVHRPFATEGGHCGFAPSSDLEIALLKFLQRSFGHVGVDRVVSGPGLVNTHRFLCEHHGVGGAPPPTAGDPAAWISGQAADGDPLCVETMALFARMLASEAGNLGLKVMARGGLFIGGGIVPKNLDWVQRPEFMRHFCCKGPMSDLMQEMPVHVILDDRIALMGPVRYIAGTR